MRFNFYSKEYPGAEDLTIRSNKIGFYASTMMAIVYAAVFTGILIPFLGENAIVPGMVAMVVLPIAMPIIRKILFKKLDEEYAQRKNNQ